MPPAGSSTSIKLNAFTTSHLWLGLKASADVGGKIDLLTEIVVNGQVLSAGTTRCISTLTASASSPQDIATTFSAIPITTVNPVTDTLAIKFSRGRADLLNADRDSFITNSGLLLLSPCFLVPTHLIRSIHSFSAGTCVRII